MDDNDAAGVSKPSVPSATVSETRGNGAMVNLSSEDPINLDHGDPTMYESYWRKLGERYAWAIDGHESLSYFADFNNFCWFSEPKLEEEIRRLHDVVGNAKAEGHFIIVGIGSSQLIHAALYALSLNEPEPISVVSAAPYYSSYPEMTNLVRSWLHKWAGDARTFDKDGPYIEIVTSPNNPSGVIQEPVVNRAQGKIIHDLAYYWPQYTPITAQLDFDIMLFTVSKCTGHAGSRIGWALVRDKEIAKKMTKFIEINTIGVPKEPQLRAAKIFGVISDSCQSVGSPELDNFFEYGRLLMTERWKRVTEVMKHNELLSLQKYPRQFCHFFGDFAESHPAFAWMYCKSASVDFEKVLRGHKVLVRSGRRFGSDPSYVRISMVCGEEEFNLFLQRLSSAIQGIADGNSIS